jgi:cytochrome P450
MYDYASPEIGADPYPAYAQLRERAPVFHDERHDLWALSRYADVQTAFRDWHTFTSSKGVDPDDIALQGGFEVLLVMDPPRHDVLRKILRDRFTPKAVRELGARTERLICPLVADAVQTDRTDLADLAESVALASMSDFMGLPDTTGQHLQAAQRRALKAFAAGGDAGASRSSVTEDVNAFAAALSDELELRHREERDDLTATIAAGEASGLMDRSEAISMGAVAFFGALDTTAAAIAITLHLLAEHPELRAAVVRGEVPVEQAVEECMRYHAPIQWVMRTATRDVQMHGRTIPEGGRVLLLQGSANRDSRQFDHPDELDFRRPRQRYATFGEGVHFCIGAPLARLWARTAITELLRHAPEYALDGPVVRQSRADGYGIDAMPVCLRP